MVRYSLDPENATKCKYESKILISILSLPSGQSIKFELNIECGHVHLLMANSSSLPYIK